MSDQYFVRLKGRIRGPFSREQLSNELTHGRFGAAYEVSTNKNDWEPGRQIAQQLQQESSVARSSFVEKIGSREVLDLTACEVSPREPANKRQSTSRTEPVPTNAQWYWTVDGRHMTEYQGTLNDLQRQIALGRLQPCEFVRHAMGDVWLRADTVDELAGSWDTVRLRRLSRLSGALGVISFLMCLITLTILVARWSSQSRPSDPVLWITIGIGNALALITLIISRFAYIEWFESGAPKSSELPWLETGVICGAAAIIPSVILTTAFLLSLLWNSAESQKPSSVTSSVSRSHVVSPQPAIDFHSRKEGSITCLLRTQCCSLASDSHCGISIFGVHVGSGIILSSSNKTAS